jgi:hypothetical protein
MAADSFFVAQAGGVCELDGGQGGDEMDSELMVDVVERLAEYPHVEEATKQDQFLKSAAPASGHPIHGKASGLWRNSAGASCRSTMGRADTDARSH